jgi:hypothetical protein
MTSTVPGLGVWAPSGETSRTIGRTRNQRIVLVRSAESEDSADAAPRATNMVARGKPIVTP